MIPITLGLSSSGLLLSYSSFDLTTFTITSITSDMVLVFKPETVSVVFQRFELILECIRIFTFKDCDDIFDGHFSEHKFSTLPGGNFFHIRMVQAMVMSIFVISQLLIRF